MITDIDIAEFQALYRKRFGQDIDTKTARQKLIMLVRQMELFYRPIRKPLTNENGDENERRQPTP